MLQFQEATGIRDKKSEKRKSWKPTFGKSSSDKRSSVTDGTEKRSSVPDEPTTADINFNQITTNDIPTSDLDLIHYIIGHGILRRDLR